MKAQALASPLRRTLTVLLLALTGCAGGHAEGLDTGQVPEDVRSDYALFAERCSKCHSLARPLNSGIDDDDYWRMYVDRMRRQPGSGISPEDATIILRFLHSYSLEQRRKKQQHDLSPPPLDASAVDAAPAATVGQR